MRVRRVSPVGFLLFSSFLAYTLRLAFTYLALKLFRLLQMLDLIAIGINKNCVSWLVDEIIFKAFLIKRAPLEVTHLRQLRLRHWLRQLLLCQRTVLYSLFRDLFWLVSLHNLRLDRRVKGLPLDISWLHVSDKTPSLLLVRVPLALVPVGNLEFVAHHEVDVLITTALSKAKEVLDIRLVLVLVLEITIQVA